MLAPRKKTLLQDVPVPPELLADVPDVEPVAAERLGRRSALVVIADASMAVEQVRIGAQVRLKHLARNGATCRYTSWLLARTMAFEAEVDSHLAAMTKSHPAAPWFTRVKGTGGEAIGKVLGHIEAFGRFYDVGDPMIPKHVIRQPVMVPVPSRKDPEVFVDTPMVWVEGIERLETPSKLRKYAGMVPGQRRESGAKTDFNTELRTMLWRLGASLLKAGGKYYGFYGDYKTRLTHRLASEGVRILPTPKGRFCAACEEEVVAKAARLCPKCGGELSLKQEPPGVKWQGHVHLMCQRRMQQLFLDHLWVVWREALGLPLREPYPIEYLGHSTVISPWDMVDREAAAK